MRKNSFTEGVQQYRDLLVKKGKFSTAKSYQDALNSLIRFFGRDGIAYNDITRTNLHRYQDDLLKRGLSRNTVSTYMRRVRCIYNQAVENEKAPYIPNLFKGIFTGVESCRKKAVTQEEIRRLITAPVRNPGLRQAQLAVTLMFQYGGMAFVDLSHLRARNLQKGILDYKRQKTGTPMRILIPEATQSPFQVLSAHTHPDSPYLFPFLSGTKKGEAAYREYTSSLARFNRDLKALAQATGVSSPVSSYTIRHSFASILKELDVPIEMISELLGHKSIKTTQIYLKSFSLEKMASVSRMCFESVCVCEAE